MLSASFIAKAYIMLIIAASQGLDVLRIDVRTSYPATFTKTECEERLNPIITYLTREGVNVIYSGCIIAESTGLRV